jgi:hypothetical protein
MWDNPHALGNQVDRSNPWITSLGNVEHSWKRFSSYCSNDLWAEIEQVSCRQYKPGDFLSVRRLNRDEILQQQPNFRSETAGYSGRLRYLWRNHILCDGEFHGSRWILTSFTSHLECGDVYALLEYHVSYTLRRGCRYAESIYTMLRNVYACLRPIATCRTLMYI